jgi:hypothetical protein
VTGQADEPLLLWATDLSAEGVWLETPEPIARGAELVVCFRPAVWWQAREIIVFGEVARVSQGLREEDHERGLGIAFLDLTSAERWALRCWLRPRPELAPGRRARPRQTTHVCASVELSVPIYTDHPFASRVS